MESLKQAKRVVAKADRRLRRAHRMNQMGTEYTVSPEGKRLLDAFIFALDRVIAAENRKALRRISIRFDSGEGMTPAQIDAFLKTLEF